MNIYKTVRPPQLWPKPKNEHARELYDEHVRYATATPEECENRSEDFTGPPRSTYARLNRWPDLTAQEADEIYKGRYYTVRARRMYPELAAMAAAGNTAEQISAATGIKPKNVRYILRKGAQLRED